MLIALPILILLSLALGTGLWLLLGLNTLVATTTAILGFCQDILIRCIELPEIGHILFLWLGAGLLCIGLLYAAIKNGTGLLRSKLAIKRLPKQHNSTGGNSTVIIEDTSSMTAFTYGLFRPRVYLSRGLIQRLSSAELRGVYRHEQQHRRGCDPARFLLYSIISDSLFFIPVIGHFVSELLQRAELKADRFAAVTETERLNLAMAMIKVAKFNKQQRPLNPAIPVPACLTGLSSKAGRVRYNLEHRLRCLIDGVRPARAPFNTRTVVISLLAATLITVSLTGTVSPSLASVPDCDKGHCEMHSDTLGNECKIHCSTSKHNR